MEDYKKRYEKALDIAKSSLDHYRQSGYEEILPYMESEFTAMFSEIKESEDERIREEIIEFLKEHCLDSVNLDTYHSWINWLEKQPMDKGF